MAKKIVFMTEEEVIEAVGKVTGENEAELKFNEDLELDVIQFPALTVSEKMETFMKSLKEDNHVTQNHDGFELPVTSFIPAFSKLLEVELKNEVDVCECNLYEDEVLYAFKIA